MATISSQTLLAWAQSNNGASRAALAETLSDLFAESGPDMSDRERSLMGDILHKVVVGLETAVRRSLAEKLADLPDAPADLITVLANDEADVAFPVLTRSRVLADAELIEVIRHRTLEHQLAVAMRFSVSEQVSAALAATGEQGVIETLLRNENARISQATMAYLVDESRRVDVFREPLLRRSELDPDLAKRMFLWVSAALRNSILERFDFDADTIDRLLEEAVQENIDETLADDGPSGAANLAQALDEEGQLDSETLVRALASGEVNLFVAMFAEAADLRERLVRRILFAEDAQEFAIACRGVGFDCGTFEQFVSLSRSARPHRGAAGRTAADDAVEAFQRLPQDAAKRIVARWRQDPDFVPHAGEADAAAGAGA